MNSLEKLVKNKRVALVGPSPHLVGSNLGDKIDSFDIVCRINEVLFAKKLRKDYGSRTDICFWNMGTAHLKEFSFMVNESKEEFDNVKLVVCPRHSLHVTPYHLQNFSPERNVFKNFESLNLDKKFFHIGDEKNIEFENAIGCHASIGSLAIMMLCEYDLKELYICGMSFYQTSMRYHDEEIEFFNNIVKKDVKAHTPGGHNSQVELRYFRENLKKYPFVTGDYYFKKLFA